VLHSVPLLYWFEIVQMPRMLTRCRVWSIQPGERMRQGLNDT
jgi:hypothetical protein